MSGDPKGTLIIIGGAEEKYDAHDRPILERVAEKARGEGPLLVTSVASRLPEEEWEMYCGVFRDLGVEDVSLLGLKTREDAHDPERIEAIGKAAVIFFTGGDQMRITSQLGGTPVLRCIHDIYRRGAAVAGTSAGAAAMPDTMLMSGRSEESYRVSGITMAPGLGLLPGVVTDSHFAERGRMGRLLGAVALNPGNLGLGIDENTAVVVERGARFSVVGDGAVYVLDGNGMSYTSLSESRSTGVVTICDVNLHVLGAGDAYDLCEKRPLPARDAAN